MNLNERAKRIKLFIMDVDGVLTDGRLYYTEKGEDIKVFNVRDGLGIKLLQQANVKTAVISGRNSNPLYRRLSELGIDEVYLGYNEKLPILEDLTKKHSIDCEDVAFIGDDYVDIPIMKRVGFPIAVRNASRKVRDICLYVTKARGGDGAVREAIEYLLDLRGELENLLKTYYGL
ncbi:MAG: KdsC family phosphatase [Aquificaceae bacterium]